VCSSDLSGKGEFGLRLELCLVARKVDVAQHKSNSDQRKGNQREWTQHAGNFPAEKVRAQTYGRGPHHGAGGIRREKAVPGQLIDASQKCREAAQDRNEPTKENDQRAVSHEQVLPKLDARVAEAEISLRTQQEAKAEPAPEHVADIVADDRSRSGSGNDGRDAVAPLASMKRGDDQDRLAWKGDSNAFEPDQKREPEVAVFGEEVVEEVKQGGLSGRRYLGHRVRAVGAWSVLVAHYPCVAPFEMINRLVSLVGLLGIRIPAVQPAPQCSTKMLRAGAPVHIFGDRGVLSELERRADQLVDGTHGLRKALLFLRAHSADIDPGR
jgi:hypothetical protein